MDTLSKRERSELMSRVRSKDTRPELIVRRLVHAMGYRYRLHVPGVPGRPDLVFRRLGKVILIHGCFWHRHRGCPSTRTPKSRIAFWTAKFDANVRRDQIVRRQLRREGWKTLIIWECETAKLDRLRGKLAAFLEE